MHEFLAQPVNIIGQLLLTSVVLPVYCRLRKRKTQPDAQCSLSAQTAARAEDPKNADFGTENQRKDAPLCARVGRSAPVGVVKELLASPSCVR
jgi:hypothetical protein